jgi:hypothetical protein|tara:strand:- start:246 stop:530 length:285 start_codon:yes stop_codon:yes gene_type:complete
MSKMHFVGQFSKTLGYLAFGLNNVLRFAGNVTRKVADSVSSTERYDVEILVEGATTVTHLNQSASQLSNLLVGMDRFGVTEVIIKKHTDNTSDK